MTNKRVAVIISTSSTEACFLPAILRECHKFAKEIIVTLGSARFDGTPEPDYLQGIANAEENADVRFIQYNVTKEIEFNPLKYRPHAFWHNISRIAGIQESTDADWILFLDGDEVPDGALFKSWLDATNLAYGSYKMANYWYFKDVQNQALQWEDSVLMVPSDIFKNQQMAIGILMQDNERDAIATSFEKQHRNVVHHEMQRPMFHHYSWVRTKADILNKVRNWGHKNDHPWEKLIKETWDAPFAGRDFVHHYEYQTVDNVFGIDISGSGLSDVATSK